MAKEGSVAPRERVNIVYRPAQGDAREEVELPLKMLVLGDFKGCHDARPVEEREPVKIDKESFNEVLRGHRVEIDLRVPNRLAGDGADDLDLRLRVESMRDFEPAAVVEQVPELKRLLELREALRALKGPLANAPGFRKKIQDLIQDEDSRQKLLTEISSEG